MVLTELAWLAPAPSTAQSTGNSSCTIAEFFGHERSSSPLHLSPSVARHVAALLCVIARWHVYGASLRHVRDVLLYGAGYGAAGRGAAGTMSATDEPIHLTPQAPDATASGSPRGPSLPDPHLSAPVTYSSEPVGVSNVPLTWPQYCSGD